MKTVQIKAVRFIKEDKDKNPLNLFVLELANGKPSIVRSAKEFITDLQGSFLIGTHVRNPLHPDVLDVLADLNIEGRLGTASGEILFAKQGENWTVTENSRVITDKNHPKYGKVAIGDKLPYEKDMTLVTDGFLNISLNPVTRMENKQAKAYGMSLASMLNAFDSIDSTSSSNVSGGAEPIIDGSLIDDDVINEAIGAEQVADTVEQE